MYNNITHTNVTKVKFTTRYVAGANFLGEIDRQVSFAPALVRSFVRYPGLITFCCAFGITIGTMGKRGEPMLHFFLILNEIVMKLITLVMWYVPVSRTRVPTSGPFCLGIRPSVSCS